MVEPVEMLIVYWKFNLLSLLGHRKKSLLLSWLIYELGQLFKTEYIFKTKGNRSLIISLACDTQLYVAQGFGKVSKTRYSELKAVSSQAPRRSPRILCSLPGVKAMVYLREITWWHFVCVCACLCVHLKPFSASHRLFNALSFVTCPSSTKAIFQS